jgi:glycosyltransferase involved in cell wall biosynthesis
MTAGLTTETKSQPHQQAGSQGHGSQEPPPSGEVRVCFIGHNLYGLLYPSSGLEFGGAEVQLRTLAAALAKRPGMCVSLLAGDGREARRDAQDGVAIVLHPHVGGHLRPPAPSRETAWDRLAARARASLDRCPPSVASTVRGLVRGFYTCRRRVAALPPIAALILAQREYQRVRAWMSVLEPIDADIYVTRCSGEAVGYVQRACRKMGRAFVYMVAHEFDVSGEYGRANGLDGLQYERGLRGADVVICQHRDQVELLRAHYGREGRVLPSLCPVPAQAGRRQAERRIVLWVARLEQWKQPELVIGLARRFPKETFVMVAPPTRLDKIYSARIETEVAAQPNMRLIPGVPFHDITALFEDAKMFVNTSHYEGFPNTFLQAAACGTPIVSWAVNPEGLLNREGIGYCAEQNPAKFEADVRRLCETPALREELGENGQRYVAQHHDPERIAQAYAELFVKLAPSAKVRIS